VETFETLQLPDGLKSSRSVSTSGRKWERVELPDGSTEETVIHPDGSTKVEIYDAPSDSVTVYETEADLRQPDVVQARSQFRVRGSPPLA
jgi:hypothetical protein